VNFIISETNFQTQQFITNNKNQNEDEKYNLTDICHIVYNK
jgi:hypothetical protein